METPVFGPYNILMCRPGTVFSVKPNLTTSSGRILSFDVKIFSPATSKQNLFSIRNSGNNYVSLTAYYDPSDGRIKVALQNPTWNIVLTSTISIILGI